jgi:hypothetical protein
VKSSIDITKKSKEEMTMLINEFSEDSQRLEECLTTIFNQGLHTVGSCKGYHFTVFIRKDKVETVMFNAAPYIGFKKGEDWGSYLDIDLINDQNVFLDDFAIRYTGEDPDGFFERLNTSFLTGKKDNKDALDRKKAICTDESYNIAERKAYEFGLRRNGLDDRQVKELMKLYDERNITIDRIKNSQGVKQKLYITKLYQLDRKFSDLIGKYYKKKEGITLW